MGCFVVAEFLLTSASRGPSAIAKPLVIATVVLMLRASISVCPSVTLVDCDHTVHKKWKWAHDRIGGILATCTQKLIKLVIPGITNSTEEDQWGREKCGVLQFRAISTVCCTV